MAKRGKNVKPTRGPRKEASRQNIATFQKNATSGKNEVDNVELNPSLSDADTVVFNNTLKSNVVIVLWGKDQVLKNAGIELFKGGPRAIFLASNQKVEFAITGAPGDTCHYKVMVPYSDKNGPIGDGEADKLGGRFNGQDPEIIIGG